MSTARALEAEEIGAAVARLAPWFHNLHLPDGTQTRPDHELGDFPGVKWRVLAPLLPEDLTGWRVLDIGCNAGFYAFALAQRGARVLGIDCDRRYLAQAEWARDVYGLQDRVELREMDVYALGALEARFDLVVFMGVFYHLRYPLLGLDLAAEKTSRLLVFQTSLMPGSEELPPPPDFGLDDRSVTLHPGWPRLAFIENRMAGDQTNWWLPNHAAVEAMLRSTGMRVLERPGQELYLCEPITPR